MVVQACYHSTRRQWQEIGEFKATLGSHSEILCQNMKTKQKTNSAGSVSDAVLKHPTKKQFREENIYLVYGSRLQSWEVKTRAWSCWSQIQSRGKREMFMHAFMYAWMDEWMNEEINQ